MTNQAEVRNVYYVLRENSNLVEKLSETPTPYLAMQDAPYSMTLEQLEKALEIDKILIHNGVIYDKESFVQANADAIQKQKEESEGVESGNSFEFVTTKDFQKAMVEMTNFVMQVGGNPALLNALMPKPKPGTPATPVAPKPDDPQPATPTPAAPKPADPQPATPTPPPAEAPKPPVPNVNLNDPKALADLGIVEEEEEEEEEEEDGKGDE